MGIGAAGRWSITLPTNMSPSWPGERSSVASEMANLRTCMRCRPSFQSGRVEDDRSLRQVFCSARLAGPFDADGATMAGAQETIGAQPTATVASAQTLDVRHASP